MSLKSFIIAACAGGVILAGPAVAQQGQGRSPSRPQPATPAGISAANVDTTQWRSEIIVEGGVAQPTGDLAAHLELTDRGFGAGLAYVVGLRVRWYPTPTVVVSPGFQFTKYRAFHGVDDVGTAYHVAVSDRAFGLDLLYQTPGDDRAVRPYLGVGAALAQHHYQEEYPDSRYEARVNSLAIALRAGVRVQSFEFALSLVRSEFTTPRFFYAGGDVTYAWNSAQVTVGYILPRF
jgi:hypothetical protein